LTRRRRESAQAGLKNDEAFAGEDQISPGCRLARLECQIRSSGRRLVTDRDAVGGLHPDPVPGQPDATSADRQSTRHGGAVGWRVF
jgi:hypothetical protein